MIRRTFKARTPRNIISNKIYQVWWSVTSSRINRQHELLQSYYYINYSITKNLERKNFTTGHLKRITTSKRVVHYNIGTSTQRLTSIFKNKYQPGTGWQTKNQFINSYNKTTFSLNLFIKEKRSYQQTILKTLTPYNNFFNSNYIYFNFFLQTQIVKYINLWKIKKLLRLYKIYGSKRYFIYSKKEWFSRVIINRNINYIQHPYLIYQITRIKH